VGGGILCRYGSPIVIVGNVLRNNRAGYVGGAIAVLDCSPRIERNIIQRNQAQVRGGGVDASGAGTNAVVRANTIVENVGGGVSCVLSAATITENLITGSTYTSTGSGGWGTYCFEANVVLNCNNSWGNEESDVCSGGSGNISEDPLACITSAEYHVGPDSPCLPENNACGVLIGANGVGCTATDAASRTPLAEVRLSAWPNPFNPLTVIRFSVPAHRERVHVAVYDIRGRLVANLVDAPMLALKGSVAWDGIDEKGFPVGSGVYIARLVAGSYQTATRLVLIK
jgi:hypothetical protein